ncbi:Vps62-related protein [Pseudomonas sp. Eth.TT006]
MSNQEQTLPDKTPMNPISVDNLLINFTTDFQRVWDTRTLRTSDATFWRPAPAPDDLPGYFPLGDIAASGFSNLNGQRIVAVVCENPTLKDLHPKGNALSRPLDYEQIWDDSGSGAKTHVSMWRPLPPAGYVAMGVVCANDHEKPSLNAVRCVRVDLVVPAQVGDLIWNDKGSHAKKSVSVWDSQPPNAGAGEICFSSGTFLAIDSYTRPDAQAAAYALRMEIPQQMFPAPQIPVLRDYAPPAHVEPAQVTRLAVLPWFAVHDEGKLPLPRFHQSPYYYLERSDQYVLLGHAHNNGAGRIFKWTVPQLPETGRLTKFTQETAIEMASDWPKGQHNYLQLLTLQTPVTLFSARLDDDFSHAHNGVGGWSVATRATFLTDVAQHEAVAIYQLHSTFRLLRLDGTQVGASIECSDLDGLHLTTYSKANEDAPATTLPTPIPVPQISERSHGEVEPDVETPAETALPAVTDTAP